MSQRGEARAPEVNPTLRASREPIRLTDLLRDVLGRLLQDEWRDDAPKGDLRIALRAACDQARNDGLRAEELLLVLKDAWRDLPDRRALPRIDTDAALARVVTACIDEYYESPRKVQQLGDGPALRSEAPFRNDAQNAEAY